jgi:late competence protein required for DNA uptake (superfamily II DNA/RNA helicase)
MHLKKYLPGFTLVYNPSSMDPARRRQYASLGCCNTSEILMDDERRQRLTKDFEQGRLKKVIATTVWNVGVSFNNLRVLIRGEGSSSDIASIQIPGRVSRIADGKDGGVVHDYFDTFSAPSLRNSKARAKVYTANGWNQVPLDELAAAVIKE